ATSSCQIDPLVSPGLWPRRYAVREGARSAPRLADPRRHGQRWGVAPDQHPGNGPDEHVRSWTVDEANASLTWVATVVARAQAEWQDYRSHATRRARLVRQNGHGLVPADPAPIQACIDELAAEGIVLRDIARGLVD